MSSLSIPTMIYCDYSDSFLCRPSSVTINPTCRLVKRASVGPPMSTVNGLHNPSQSLLLSGLVFASAAQRRPLQAPARAGADAVYPHSSGDGSSSSLGSPKSSDAFSSHRDAFSRLSVQTIGGSAQQGHGSPGSPRGSAGSASTPLDSAARTASLALARRAADVADYHAHVRLHLGLFLTTVSEALGRKTGVLNGSELSAALAHVLCVSLAPAPASGDVQPLPLETGLLARLRPVAARSPAPSALPAPSASTPSSAALSSWYSLEEATAVLLRGLRLSPSATAGALVGAAASSLGGSPGTPASLSGPLPSPAAARGVHASPSLVRVSGLRKAAAAEAGPSVAAPGAPLPSVAVRDCADSTILLSLPSSSVSVVGCVRSTVILGPSSGHVTIDGCEGCTVMAAGRHVTLHNVTDCTVHLWAGGSRPLLLGDCRGVRLAPYAAHYAGLRAQAAGAGLLPGADGSGSSDSSANLWDTPVDCSLLTGSASPGPAPTAGIVPQQQQQQPDNSEVWALLHPSDFAMRGALPAIDSVEAASARGAGAPADPAALALASAPHADDAGQLDALPLPPAFEEEQAARRAADARIRRAVQAAAKTLPTEAATRLQLAMQAAFKVRTRARRVSPGAPRTLLSHQRAQTSTFPTAPPSLRSPQEWLAASGKLHKVTELARPSS